MINISENNMKPTKIFKRTNSQDGFCVEIESKDVVDISGTSWTTEQFHQREKNGDTFHSSQGGIYFTKDNLEEIMGLGF